MDRFEVLQQRFWVDLIHNVLIKDQNQICHPISSRKLVRPQGMTLSRLSKPMMFHVKHLHYTPKTGLFAQYCHPGAIQ
jgi:hypothetical protein